MTSEKRQAIGWAVHVAMLGIICSMIGVGYVDIKDSISNTRKSIDKIGDNQDSIKGFIHKIQLEIASFKSNRFTSSHGLEVWREIGNIKSTVKHLPSDDTQEEIDQNKFDISKIKAALGMDGGR